MAKQRLSQAKLQRLQPSLRDLITAIRDARGVFRDKTGLRPHRLSGLSRYVKQLMALPTGFDLSPFEVQLKRRLVRVQHRVYGLPGLGTTANFSLLDKLGPMYGDQVRAYGAAAGELLRTLADVDISHNHQPLLSVQEQLAGSTAN